MNIHLYRILSDPIWQSIGVIVGIIGVIVGVIGVYFGALLGSKRGHQLSVQQQQADLKEAFYNYIVSFEEELKANLEAFMDCYKYIESSIPVSPDSYSPVETGTKHIKTDVWDSFLQRGLIDFFDYEDFRKLSHYNYRIKNARRITLINVSNWKRANSHLDWLKRAKSQFDAVLSIDPDDFNARLAITVSYGIESVEEALQIIQKHLMK